MKVHLDRTVYCSGEYPAFCDRKSGHAPLMTEKSLDTSEALQIPNLQQKKTLRCRKTTWWRKNYPHLFHSEDLFLF